MGKVFYRDLKLGVLGGGQLGRMLIQEAINFDVFVAVLDPSPIAPCAKIASEFVIGDIQDFNTVYEFGKSVDVLTIEIEHVNVDALEKLEKEGVKVYPKPSNLRTVQDKGLQKEFYEAHGIPTSSFKLIDNKSELSPNELPCVQKLRKGGYDGKGVIVLKEQADLSNAFDAPCVVEEVVDFEKEIAVIIARNESGDVKSFPIVELEFNPEANLVEYLFAPANVSEDVNIHANEIAEKLINALDFVGILAVEMFVTKTGEVLVNEIAPRPHNSGHHTIEANITSQYEQHIRSVLDVPLGATDAISAAVMINLLGEKEFEGDVFYENLNEVLAIKGSKIHIYGKKQTKSFRKMGHVTVVDQDLEKAKQKAKEVKSLLKVKA